MANVDDHQLTLVDARTEIKEHQKVVPWTSFTLKSRCAHAATCNQVVALQVITAGRSEEVRNVRTDAPLPNLVFEQLKGPAVIVTFG